jgi:hypothetical protein
MVSPRRVIVFPLVVAAFDAWHGMQTLARGHVVIAPLEAATWLIASVLVVWITRRLTTPAIRYARWLASLQAIVSAVILPVGGATPIGPLWMVAHLVSTAAMAVALVAYAWPERAPYGDSGRESQVTR